MNTDQIKSFIYNVAVSVVAGIIVILLTWLWQALYQWVVLGLGLLAGLVLFYLAYRHGSKLTLLLGLLTTAIVLVTFFLLFTSRPWCKPEVLGLDVSYHGETHRFYSADSITVAPHTVLTITAISQYDLACTWQYTGDFEKPQASGCILSVISGADQNPDLVLVTVQQRLCSSFLRSLIIESQRD
jgi:hypothetical protein